MLPDGTSCWSRSEILVGTPETRAAGQFPARREHWTTVDVTAARIHRIEDPADFSVLLAARGLVYTQDVPIATSRGTSALCGWNCESTAWLTEPKPR
jgi:hypothetical protein